MPQIKKQSAFTLVELIVVITILAILGTIAFVSFQGYSKSARDSSRLNDVRIVEKNFSIHGTKGNTLPIPDAPVNITASGTSLGYQGLIGSGVLSSIGQAGKILDPLDSSQYTYYKDSNSNTYQILSFMEKSGSTRGSNSVNDKFVKTSGEKIGILYDNVSENTIEKSYTGSSIDLMNNSQDYSIFLNDTYKFSSSGSLLGSFALLGETSPELIEYDTNLIGRLDYRLSEEVISHLGESTINVGNIENHKDQIKCDGSSRILYGSGADLIGGLDEFTIFLSYKIERGENASTYPLVLSSWGTTSGYNLACQHNLSDIDNPGLSCYVDINDGSGGTAVMGGSSSIEYGVTQNIIVTGKNGIGKTYFNGEKIDEEFYTGTINPSRGEGISVCARPTGGYHFNGIINKIYTSSVGLGSDENIEAFYQKIQ